MQFSLKSILVLITVLAACFAWPSLVGVLVWYALPGMLMTLAWPSTDDLQTFARASLTTYLVLAVPGYSAGLTVLISLPLVLGVGWLSVQVARRRPVLAPPPRVRPMATDLSREAEHTDPQSARGNDPR